MRRDESREPPPIDGAVLDRLRDLGVRVGEDLLGQVTGLFQTLLPQRLEALESELAQGHLERVAQLAHSIKGSAGTVGAVRLGLVAAELEAHCREQRLPDRADVDELRAELEAALEALAGLRQT